MLLTVLSSGSGGNCAWIEAGSARVLVDAGLSLRETARRCAARGLALRGLTDLVLTHEHADHAHGAGVLARKLGARVHATPGTLAALRDRPPAELCVPLAAGEERALGDGSASALRVLALRVPHDAAQPVAYRFEERTPDGRRARAAVVTDLGHVPAAFANELDDLDALVLEMNHDERMLAEGPYPPRLQRRIRSNVGHLSNEQGAGLLRQVLHAGLRHVLLAHLSEHNNTPSLARRAASAVLAGSPFTVEVSVASQSGPSARLEFAPRPPALQRPAGPSVSIPAPRLRGRRPLRHASSQQLALF